MSDTLVVRGYKFRPVKLQCYSSSKGWAPSPDRFESWEDGLSVELYFREYSNNGTAHKVWGAKADYGEGCCCTYAWHVHDGGFETPEEALDFVISAVESHGNTFLRIAAKLRGEQP